MTSDYHDPREPRAYLEVEGASTCASGEPKQFIVP